MAADDLALALMMLDNERVLWEVSSADFKSLDGFDLTDEERRLLVEATKGVVAIEEQVPVPFASSRRRVGLAGPGGRDKGFGYWPPSAAEAIRYVQANLSDPRMAASFVAWQEQRADEFP